MLVTYSNMNQDFYHGKLWKNKYYVINPCYLTFCVVYEYFQYFCKCVSDNMLCTLHSFFLVIDIIDFTYSFPPGAGAGWIEQPGIYLLRPIPSPDKGGRFLDQVSILPRAKKHTAHISGTFPWNYTLPQPLSNCKMYTQFLFFEICVTIIFTAFFTLNLIFINPENTKHFVAYLNIITNIIFKLLSTQQNVTQLDKTLNATNLFYYLL